MSPVAPLLGLALLAADVNVDTVVLVGRRTGVPAAEARAIAEACSKGLSAQGVTMAMPPAKALKQLAKLLVKDTATCAGRAGCVAELGRQLGVAHVVAVSVSRVEKETAVGLELVRVADETVVETDSLLLPKKKRPTTELLAPFAEKVKAALAPPKEEPPPEQVEAPPPPDDAPKEVKLEPPPKEEVPPPPPPPEKSHTTSFVLGGAGVAALGAGIALLAMGLSSQAALSKGTVGPDGRTLSPLTGAEAQQQNANGNLLMGAGAGAAAVGAGLGATAVILW